jgi:hypothetical protein
VTKKYRARTNGNVVELSDEAARVLVPVVYEEVDDEALTTEPAPAKRKRKRRTKKADRE